MTLATQIQAAKPGDTIALPPGVYDGPKLSGLAFSPPIIITSADPANRATVTDFTLTNCRGIVLKGLDLLANNPKGLWAFNATDCFNIAVEDCAVHGSLDGNVMNDEQGLAFMRCMGVRVHGCEFQQLQRAIALASCDFAWVLRNDFHDLRQVGILGAGSSNVLIEANDLHDFYPNNTGVPSTTDHMDAIHLHTVGIKASARNVVIRKNRLWRGKGRAAQGIFSETNPNTMPTDGLTITDNIVVGLGYNGLTVYGAKNLTVARNTVASVPDASGLPGKAWILIKGTDGATISDNSSDTVIDAARILAWGNTNAHVGKNPAIPIVTDGGSALLSAAKPDQSSPPFTRPLGSPPAPS